jgi:hypothetical protein
MDSRCRTTHAYITEVDHDQVNLELPPLPAGLAEELLAASGELLGASASGVLGVNIWSGLSSP